MFIRSKKVKIRKIHICVGCGLSQGVGTHLTVTVQADNGKIFSDYWCDICIAYWNEHCTSDDYIPYIGVLRLEDESGWNRIASQVQGE